LLSLVESGREASSKPTAEALIAYMVAHTEPAFGLGTNRLPGCVLLSELRVSQILNCQEIVFSVESPRAKLWLARDIIDVEPTLRLARYWFLLIPTIAKQ
jgi:hypothetical protein